MDLLVPAGAYIDQWDLEEWSNTQKDEVNAEIGRRMGAGDSRRAGDVSLYDGDVLFGGPFIMRCVVWGTFHYSTGRAICKVFTAKWL